MIIELLLTLIAFLVKSIFIFINLPPFPAEGQVAVNNYFDLIFDNLDFLGFFVHTSTLSIVATLAITLWSFSKLYKVTIWIYHKLPISSK